MKTTKEGQAMEFKTKELASLFNVTDRTIRSLGHQGDASE
jgi:hypothetical protein